METMGLQDARVFAFTVLKDSTNDFSVYRIIGQGGSGVIYKGVLNNGEVIAVKKLDIIYDSSGVELGNGEAHFHNELMHLIGVKHKNIVRLVGYCYEVHNTVTECDGKPVFASMEERILCLEYLPSGSLKNHLSAESCGLEWHLRYNIMKGICEGLKYLHTGNKNPIYHLDLKPENIFLDSNMIPKIGDFGISTLAADSMETYKTENALGTLGYMAPEYLHRNQVSHKSDVYSLGVTMIQVIAGEEGYRNYDPHAPSEEFIELVHKNWGKRRKAMSSHALQQVRRCTEIALRCVEYDQEKRPTITDIVDELDKIGPAESKATEMSNMENQGLQHTSAIPTVFQLQFLKRITNNFSKNREIGHGAYGVVYKGVLNNGEMIAVKRLHNHLVDDTEFKNEITKLMGFKHPNIVRLLGYCYEATNTLTEVGGNLEFVGIQERAVCLEYLQGGSLDGHLSDELHGHEWHVRYRIIKGICEGLKHLHTGSEKPIFHMDLKPGNILLDTNMIPKIADFGISILLGSMETCVIETVTGTIGYIAPEYINLKQVSEKSDVYSLGVIMIRIIAGNQGFQEYDPDRPYKEFIERVHENWGKRLPTMSLNSLEQVMTCTEIALRSVEFDRHKRPTITQIIDELNKIDAGESSAISQFKNMEEDRENNLRWGNKRKRS